MSSSLKASMPAFSVAGILNLPGRGPGSSFATPQRSTAYAQPQIAETSRQGAARSNTSLTPNQPASNQHNNRLSSGSANGNNNVVKAKFNPEGADRERHQTSQYTRLPSHTIQSANQIASRLDNFDQHRPSGSAHQNITESSRQGGFCSHSDQRSNENQQLSPERSVFSFGHGPNYIDTDVDKVEFVERITPNSRTPQSSKKKSPSHLSPSRNGSTRTSDFCLDSDEVEFVENRPYSDSMQATLRTSPSKTPASPSFASTSSPLPSARQSQHPPAPNGVFNEKPRANANTYSNVHSEKRNIAGSSSRLAGQTRTFGQPAMNLNYDPPRDSDDNAPRSVCSSLPETPRALKDKRIPPVSYDTKSMEDGAIGTPPMISLQRNNLRPQTPPHASPNASNTSHAMSQPVPQTIPQAGVKRRLGMGRSVIGYSNKKFKKPL
ncbi:hypothetical protein BDN70DRAFT_680205 [Pholiota conissans]|uniref:Uncharacterized protein n=1 Tax=Pholiota conissans TaxID=109636 RepID=A0A9P5ZD19_9AGAR|nr:hypothetical protein BDN70DRAFT_680205 [Pholiota conissans]